MGVTVIGGLRLAVVHALAACSAVTESEMDRRYDWIDSHSPGALAHRPQGDLKRSSVDARYS